ncbi:8-amino-7-oxononanoate synthase [Paracoccus aestuariivivens]|uniref:Aminotransferase class I/II-fold pyridoxal phosphate-dependent enzyme n=1 Tax=Paracoccus aestuariivivens TaxID=1820333 RepID=A0A6L6J8Y4_9RHOB|nr:8-amino-7-oxononanoate synthase [Paracoccus aestuariivivens]MTH78460.1 aminotransferase class I/II-fold pyridoxal phosphate-dependent enzyme [Paracoccus aestuariivivens]
MTAYPRHAERLSVLGTRGRLRELAPAAGLDFASNDYLGLATSPALRDAVTDAIRRGVPVGATGSRLLRGNHPEHVALETMAAQFFGSEAALYMGGGFQANQAIFSALPMADDLVLHDALIHASAHEGFRLGAARTESFRHNDVADAERVLRGWRNSGGRGRVWIALETIYSMQGDFAPLADFAALAARHDAVLVLDEAHATGVYGPLGRGFAAEITDCPVIALHTCGKALAASGALVCADRAVIDTLVNRARPFIFATAPSPLMAVAARAALEHLQRGPDCIATAARLRAHAHACARRIGYDLPPGQILPILIRSDHAALAAARKLQRQDFDVRAIRPPTVPKGTARLRVSITGNLGPDDISALFTAIGDLKQKDFQ